MRYLIIATIFIVGILITYETEHIVGEEGLIIAGEGVAIAQQHNKPLPPDFFAQDVVENGLCFVGQTFTIKATIHKADMIFTLGLVTFETNDDSVFFSMHTEPILDFLDCNDYYKDGGTYTFPIYIDGINIYKADDPLFHNVIEFHEEVRGRKGRRNASLFAISSVIMITEKFKKEMQEANCWAPDRW